MLALLWDVIGFGEDEGSGGEVAVVVWLSRGLSCRRGGEIERPPLRGSENVLILAPDMARRRVRASRSGSFEGVSVREVVGRSGVQGQGMAMVSSKGREARGGVTRSVVAAAVVVA